MPTTKPKRTREQVHQDGGHTTFVASCSACMTEREAVEQAELARAQQPPAEDTTETADPTISAAPTVPEPAGEPAAAEPASTGSTPVARAGDGRPRCVVPDCVLPEFVDGIGVCGGHYATHRGYANKV